MFIFVVRTFLIDYILSIQDVEIQEK